MIDTISIQGFKSLNEVTLRLSPLNIFIGTNASGKSNFFDALRVIQGIGYGLTVDEILNGKPKTSSNEVWEAIRGGSRGLAFQRIDAKTGKVWLSFVKISVEFTSGQFARRARYSITFSALSHRVVQESLSLSGDTIYDSVSTQSPTESPVLRVKYRRGTQGQPPRLEFESSRPALTQLVRHKSCSKEHAELIRRIALAMGNMQKLDPSPAVLREYSRSGMVQRMGERGENFAALVHAISQNERAMAAYQEWLKQLTPSEAEAVHILRGALDEPMFGLRNGPRSFPAPALSDGTLRFAAIAAAFFQPDPPEVLMLEEVENGIHPTRLRLLLDLLKSQADSAVPQVMATTHSPVVLSWLQERDYPSVFFCKRIEETGASEIVPLSKLPRLKELARQQSIADLYSEGWLETAV